MKIIIEIDLEGKYPTVHVPVKDLTKALGFGTNKFLADLITWFGRDVIILDKPDKAKISLIETH